MTNSIHILHVEDDAGFADLTAEALEREEGQFEFDHVSRRDGDFERRTGHLRSEGTRGTTGEVRIRRQPRSAEPARRGQGRLELAREDCDGDHLDDVAQAHARMSELIQDLLALAREGDPLRERESVDPGALAESCWQNVQTTGATLATETERAVLADRSRLQQLLENLVRNAVEHGSTSPDSQARQDAVDHGSTSPHSTSSREDAVDHGGEDVTVTVGEVADGFYVEDDGPGIPPDDREHLFEIGYSGAAGGTGFGLSIVERVADAHGWTVHATEGTDGGARFEIRDVEFVEGT